MKVLITLLLAVLICARKVVDPITMEIRMEPKTVDILMKQLINDIQQRNSTSEKVFDSAQVKFEVNKEKYESIIRSLQAKIVNEKGNIAESLKELKVLQNKRSAYVTIKKSTSSIDDEIKTTKNSIAIKEKLIKGIQKQIHHVKKALQHNKKVWIQQQAIHLKTLRSLEKRKEKVNNLQEVIDLVNIKNNASNILSQEFIDAIVCGGKEERRAYFFMKEKTDKNSEKLLHMLIKAKDLAEQLIKPSTQTVISNKYNVSMKHAISRRDKAVANVARLQKKLYTLNKQILDVSNECNIASGSIQKSCLKKQYKLQEKRKQLKNVVRRAKSLKIQASLDVSNIQTRISAEVSKISKDQTIEARKKVSDWLQKSDAQMKKARSIAALMSKEEVVGCGMYQRAMHYKKNAVVDRIINLRQRRKQVYEKMASVLHKEEKAINSHINILSNAGDKLEKAALKFAKYEAKGALVDKKSESLKVEANEKRSLAADQADEMIVKWRSIVSQENKDIYQLEKKEKQLLKRIEELKDGVMKLTTNITIATLMDEIEEGKTIIKQKTELLRVLNDMIKRMVERSLGKSSVMRKAALARLIELKKYKVDVKKKIAQLMKKASTSNSVGLTRIKSLMKKIEKQTALVVAEELYMKQMIDMCKEREIAIKYRDSKNSMIKSSNKVSSVGFKLIALMQQKEEKYRDASSQAKRLITKMELVEDDDKVLLSGIISKLQHRAKGIALDLKRLESKRREISGRLIETKFSHEQYLAERENDYRHRHGILEELLEKLKKKEDAMACKGTRSYFEKSIKLIHNRMKILEDEFKDTKDSIKRDIELITMAHGKCYNGIVDGMEGEREKCKVCVDLSEFILRKARDGVNRRKISRMLLTRCQASDKPRTCYEAAMSLMANYDEEVITKTPLGFCVKANKCVVRDW